MLDLNTRYGERTSTTHDYSLNFKFTPSERLTLTADVQRVVSSMDMLSMTAFVEPSNPFTVDFDLSGNTPTLVYTAPGDPQLNQSTYWWAAAMDHFEKNDADQWAYRADAEYAFDPGMVLKSSGLAPGHGRTRSAARPVNWSSLADSIGAMAAAQRSISTNKAAPPTPACRANRISIRSTISLPWRRLRIPAASVSKRRPGQQRHSERVRLPAIDAVERLGWRLSRRTFASINDQDKDAGWLRTATVRIGRLRDRSLRRQHRPARGPPPGTDAGDPTITIGSANVARCRDLPVGSREQRTSGVDLRPLAQLHAAIAGGAACRSMVIPTKTLHRCPAER